MLRKDGTNEFSFLLNSSSYLGNDVSYEGIQWYLIKNHNIDILNENQRAEYEIERATLLENRRRELREYYDLDTILYDNTIENHKNQMHTENKSLSYLLIAIFFSIILIISFILSKLC